MTKKANRKRRDLLDILSGTTKRRLVYNELLALEEKELDRMKTQVFHFVNIDLDKIFIEVDRLPKMKKSKVKQLIHAVVSYRIKGYLDKYYLRKKQKINRISKS
jgi:hypothetical protein